MPARHVFFPKAYELEIQPYEEGVGGATSLWAPVVQSDTGAENDDNRGRGASPLVTAAGLSPSTSYRFRVSGRNAHGARAVSGVSEVFTTGEVCIGTKDSRQKERISKC